MDQTYDNEIFFSQYARMPRSRDGLKAAGEWHQLKPLFPALEGKCVLYLGCGYGWHRRLCEEHGAARILGIDSSRRMIEEARRRGGGNGVSYRVCGVEEYEFPEKAWDLVVSDLVLHYIQDLDPVFERVWNTLREGGIFLFNVEHLIFRMSGGKVSPHPDSDPWRVMEAGIYSGGRGGGPAVGGDETDPGNGTGNASAYDAVGESQEGKQAGARGWQLSM